MDYSVELVLKYPHINIHSTDKSNVQLIDGKILVNDLFFPIILKQQTKNNGTQIYTLEKLTNIKNKCTKQNIKDILKTTSFQTILEVLDKIHDTLQGESPKNIIENHCDIYKKVLYEYSEFTKFFLNLKTCKLQEEFKFISASISDARSREHFIEITIDYNKKYGEDIFRISKFDLPKKETDYFKPNESLTALFDQFLAQIELLQPYFDLMDEFDENATILDPEMPTRRDCYRRIWLGENISTIITVDPFNIFQRPDVKFLGPERLVDTYSSNLNDNLGKWTYQESIFQAVLDLLGIEQFPKKTVTKQVVNLLVEYGECSICFCLRLNEKLSEVICTNKSCEKFYHNQCLYDWLVALNAKRVFNNISGNCPNCEKTISCPVLD